MKTGIKIAIAVSVVVVTTGVVLLVVLRKPGCGECSMVCGISCASNPKCTGTLCDDPNAVCIDGVCVVKHACDSTGKCVPDPDGPFHGDTCTCFGAPTCDGTDVECQNMARNAVAACTVVGNSGEFRSKQACDARFSDFQCVPGTGTCERVLESTTGWKTEAECKCFECNNMTCVPSQETKPENGIDGDGCAECGRWKCEDGECVQTETGGIWEDAAHCRCGLCQDGGCVATDAGGAYPSVSACQADGAKICSDASLGWGCNQTAGNAKLCVQTLGGGSPSLEECSCWTCAGEPPGPLSGCVFNAGGGKYDTHQECFEDETDKCGWKYMCPSPV